MSVGTVRSAMVPVTRRMRAYFAPVDRSTEQPVIFDPGKSGVFNLATPPSPWLDLSWVDNFQRSSGTNTDAVHAGTRGVRISNLIFANGANCKWPWPAAQST